MKFCQKSHISNRPTTADQKQIKKKKKQTNLFRKIIQDIRLERHVHIDRPRNPAQLSLSNVQDAIHPPRMFPRDLPIVSQNQTVISGSVTSYAEPIPCFQGNLLRGRF